MAGFNKVSAQPRRLAASGPLRTLSSTPDTVNHEGSPAFLNDAQTELFKRATTRFAGEKGFYETADENVDRLRILVRSLAVEDETWPWVRAFLSWLRGPGNIRTASILLAAEAVHARLEHLAQVNKGRDPADVVVGEGNRELIASVLQRPDEPGELLAYWKHRWGVVRADGTTQLKLPKPVKRGVADAVTRLYDEGAFLRYDGESKAVRFGDVLELTHADVRVPSDERMWQDDLFRYAITARQGRDAEPPESLSKVHLRWTLSRYTPDQRHALARSALEGNQISLDLIQGAMVGQWEWLKAWLGERPAGVLPLTDAEIWQLALPNLGYMAALRNLRNLDQAGVPDSVIGPLLTRLADPEQVRRSRQLPFRFWSAYAEAPSLRWGHALEQALSHSLRNVPVLVGRTLVLVDTSGSMTWGTLSGNSKMDYATAAAIFGLALKIRNPGGVDLWGFANSQFHVTGVNEGSSLLRSVEAFRRQQGRVGGGTEIARAVRETLRADHARVIILTDMQTMDNYRVGDVSSAAPANVPMYGFNVAGYGNTALPVQPGTNRHELAGLTDATFGLIPTLEMGEAGRWPWELS